MLDGKRYYAVFPDENPEIRQRMRTLFDLLKKLEKEFRRHIEQFRVETPCPDGGNKPGYSAAMIQRSGSKRRPLDRLVGRYPPIFIHPKAPLFDSALFGGPPFFVLLRMLFHSVRRMSA
jgi:hypothetical protein